MSSIRRVLASRANGARSRGPKTAAGKARSSYNAMRHGLLAACVVLPNESREGFEELLQQHLRRLTPGDDVEFGFIEEMVSAYWRLRRLWAIENAALSAELPEHACPSEAARIAEAFASLANSPQLTLIHRYETRLHKMYQRALHNLVLLRDVAVPNEPSPISGHSGAPEPATQAVP